VNHQSGAASEGFVLSNATDADEWRMYVQWNSNTLALFHNNTNVGNFDDVSGTYTAVSDRRMKRNITPIGTVLNRVKQLEVVDYQFVHQSDSHKYTGLIAQDVQKLFPNLVTEPEEESENLTMDYSGFGVLAIKAIQEQQQEIEALKEELRELKALIKISQN
jgi:ABC-type antimicrobial peptide transport system permease subunit